MCCLKAMEEAYDSSRYPLRLADPEPDFLPLAGMEAIMTKRKRSDVAQMNLRLNEPLRKMIEIEARKNGWSLNRELVRRIEQSFVEDSNKFIRGQLAEMSELLRKLNP